MSVRLLNLVCLILDFSIDSLCIRHQASFQLAFSRHISKLATSFEIMAARCTYAGQLVINVTKLIIFQTVLMTPLNPVPTGAEPWHASPATSAATSAASASPSRGTGPLAAHHASDAPRHAAAAPPGGGGGAFRDAPRVPRWVPQAVI